MSDTRSDGERALRDAIRPLAARLAWRRRWRWALGTARWATIGGALVMLVARFTPIDSAWLYAALCPAGALALAWLAAAIVPVTPERIARSGDALGLKERLTTAWELRDSASPEAALQRLDALQNIARLDTAASIRLRFDKRSLRLPAAALVVAIALGIWPSAMTGVVAARRAERATIRQEQAKIADSRKELAATTRPLSETEKQILAALQEAERKLAKAGSASKAVSELARVEQQLEGLKQPDKASTASLKQMASALSESEAARPVAEALQQSDFQRAAEALSQLGRSTNSTSAASTAAALDRASRTPGLDAQTAAALRAAAQSLAQAGQTAAAQGSGSEAAESALAEAQQSLNEAGEQLAAAGQAASGQASLASALNALAAARGNISASAATAGGKLPGAVAAGDGQGGTGQPSGSGNGSGSGSGSGGGGNGSGGSGSGTGSQPGQGAGGGAGQGSTNQASSGGQMSQGGHSTGGGASDMQQGEYERIYDPTRLGGDGQSTTLPGQSGQGPSQYIDAPNVPGGSDVLLPYSEVLAGYSAEALQSLAGSSIPPALQSLVKDYFTSLEPSK